MVTEDPLDDSSGVSDRTHRTSPQLDSDTCHSSCGVAQENTPIMMDTEYKHAGPSSRYHYGTKRQSRLSGANGDAESAFRVSIRPSSVRQSAPRWMALASLVMIVCCFTETVLASVQEQKQHLQQQQQQQHEQQHQVVVASDSIVAEDISSSPNFVTSDDKPPGGEDANCAKQRLQECLALLQTLSTDHNLAFAENEEQLKEMCKTMRSGLRCVNDHVSQCFEPEHRRRIKQLLGGTQKTVQLLCNKGPLREKYLKYAPCMRNVSTDTSLCGGHYQRLISSVDVRDTLSSQDTIRRQCCAFHTYLACVGVAAEGRCGTKAGQFVEEYSYRTAGPIILTRCRGYVPGSSMCSAPSSGPAPRLVTSRGSWLLLLLLNLLISIAY